MGVKTGKDAEKVSSNFGVELHRTLIIYSSLGEKKTLCRRKKLRSGGWLKRKDGITENRKTNKRYIYIYIYAYEQQMYERGGEYCEKQG